MSMVDLTTLCVLPLARVKPVLPQEHVVRRNLTNLNRLIIDSTVKCFLHELCALRPASSWKLLAVFNNFDKP